jgi:hypothetical protein
MGKIIPEKTALATAPAIFYENAPPVAPARISDKLQKPPVAGVLPARREARAKLKTT